MTLLSESSVLWTLLILSSMVALVVSDCDRQTGPAGVTECFLGTPYYSEFQCGTCLTNAYIIQKSGGRHICRENASYCYYQCMIETFNIAEGPVYERCSCEEREPLPQADSILSADCFSPDGTDCYWYGRCLAARYPCTGHQASTGSAVSFFSCSCILLFFCAPQIYLLAYSPIYLIICVFLSLRGKGVGAIVIVKFIIAPCHENA